MKTLASCLQAIAEKGHLIGLKCLMDRFGNLAVRPKSGTTVQSLNLSQTDAKNAYTLILLLDALEAKGYKTCLTRVHKTGYLPFQFRVLVGKKWHWGCAFTRTESVLRCVAEVLEGLK